MVQLYLPNITDIMHIKKLKKVLILNHRYSLFLFLKYLQASRLTLFRLSPFFHLDPVTAAI
jgi:hypothetical protein